MDGLATGGSGIHNRAPGLGLSPGLQLRAGDAASCHGSRVNHRCPVASLPRCALYPALAYWDHQEELDQDIERRLEFVDRVQRAMGPSPLVARLKAKGLI